MTVMAEKMVEEEGKKRVLFEVQSKECAKVLSSAFTAVFKEKKALDHFLTGVFRSNPKYGSKDRKRIGNCIFRVFRDYGFLCQILEEKDRTAENCLLLSSVFAGEKTYPQCWENSCCFPEEKLLEAAGKENILSAVQLLSGGKTFTFTDNLPSWSLSHFPEGMGEKIAEDFLKRSPVWFRLNFPYEEKKKEKICKEFASRDLELSFHPVKKDAFCVKEDKRVFLQDFSTFREGLFEVQDLSSQCIGYEDGRERNLKKILDCCAGGGGKTLQMASFLHSRKIPGKVYAWDIRKNKLEEALRRGKKAGLSNIVILESFPENEEFDKVLVDAPCSGSGRWRRAPEQRFLLTENALKELTFLQMQILEKAAGRVKNNGILLYGTCSLFTDENLMNIHSFLAKHPEFVLEEFVSPLTGEKSEGFLTIYPSSGNCDGAFVARMRKRK